MIVHLTWHELTLAAHVGVRRHAEALRQQLPDAHGREGHDGWSDHIEGACGEMAAAKALGVYWTPTVNTFQIGGDVGELQVRTRSKSDYELLVRDADKTGSIFILVRGLAPVFDVVGWLRGGDAKRPEWRKGHGGRPPAYFVPDAALQPIDSLARLGGSACLTWSEAKEHDDGPPTH
jgi:hypothetical protein